MTNDQKNAEPPVEIHGLEDAPSFVLAAVLRLIIPKALERHGYMDKDEAAKLEAAGWTPGDFCMLTHANRYLELAAYLADTVRHMAAEHDNLEAARLYVAMCETAVFCARGVVTHKEIAGTAPREALADYQRKIEADLEQARAILAKIAPKHELAASLRAEGGSRVH